MDWKEFLDFMSLAERLKCNTRHCTNSQGEPESVAEHCWRAALMALLLEPEFPGVKMERVVRMCLIHDLGEAVTGDIPSFLKTAADEATEEEAVERLLAPLPEALRLEFTTNPPSPPGRRWNTSSSGSTGSGRQSGFPKPPPCGKRYCGRPKRKSPPKAKGN